MSQRSIEEVYKSIAPTRGRGIPQTPTLSTGIAGDGNLGASLSQAAQEIAQLRAAWQQQADLITANTQAIQSNTSSKGSSSVASTVGQAASGLFGGALGLLSPIISGITHLFGSGSSQPAPLPVYTAPPPVSIDGTVRAAATPGGSGATAPSGTGATTNQTTYSPQITVNVSAMDSQSFMDRSADIASAVREAMLNNHPINGVVADL